MSLSMTQFPCLPVGMKNGVAARVGRRIYAGLGSAGKQFFCLDLDALELGWQRVAEFPGTARNDAVIIASERGIWVFSGAGAENGSSPQVLTDVYHLNAATNEWLQLDTTIPVGLLGASGCEVAPEKFVFWGGYNKALFDDFLAKLSAIDVSQEPEKHQAALVEFMSMPPKEYGWNQDLWLFDGCELSWKRVMKNPYPANCGASLIQDANQVVLIDGEIKPGLRSTQVKKFTFHSLNEVESTTLPSIQASPQEHEGLAGAYAGLVKGQYIAAGGAFFVGSQQKAREKQWYTHQGLSKHYSNNIWRFDGKQWHQAGELPTGCAYGASVSTEQGLLMLGGEDQQGQALKGCYLIDWQA